MNVSLNPGLEDFVRRKVANGRYSSTDEVVREALRLLQQRETDGGRAIDKGSVISAIKMLEPELRRRGVVSAALFGSIVQGEGRPDSDADVLIAIDPLAKFDLIDLVGIKNLLEDNLGRTVDVVEKESVDPRIRNTILAEAEVVFG